MKMYDGYKIPLAYKAAANFFLQSQSSFEAFDKLVKGDNSNSGSPLDTAGKLSPLISNISFSVELFLKVLNIQELEVAPRGHNYHEIWDKLGASTKANLNSRFLLHIEQYIKTGMTRYVALEFCESSCEFGNEPSSSFENAIARLNRSFELWRYMFEIHEKDNGVLYFSFVDAYAVANALNEVIFNYEGKAKVQVKSGA